MPTLANLGTLATNHRPIIHESLYDNCPHQLYLKTANPAPTVDLITPAPSYRHHVQAGPSQYDLPASWVPTTRVRHDRLGHQDCLEQECLRGGEEFHRSPHHYRLLNLPECAHSQALCVFRTGQNGAHTGIYIVSFSGSSWYLDICWYCHLCRGGGPKPTRLPVHHVYLWFRSCHNRGRVWGAKPRRFGHG